MADETGALVPAEEELQDNAETAGEEESGEQASQDQGETVEEHKKRLSGAQRNKIRIERLENELQEERRQRQQLLDHVLKQSSGEKKETAKPPEDKRPRKEDFIVDKDAGTYDADKYEQAVDDWRDRQYDRKLKDTLSERDQAKANESELEKINRVWTERESAYEKDHPDYAETGQEAALFIRDHLNLPGAKAAGKAIAKSELGPAILHHLGDNPEELDRIAKLPADEALIAVGEIKARLALEESAEEDETEEAESTVPPVKQPPKPPTPVKKVSSVKKPDIYDEKLPFKEFVKLREAQIKGK